MNTERNIDLLHIYGQHSWHNEAYLVGNASALTKLRSAIDRALSANDGLALAEVFADDGEGYEAIIVRLDDAWDNRENGRWSKLVAPYTADYAQGDPNSGMHPFDLLGVPPGGHEARDLIKRLRNEDGVEQTS